MSAKATSGANIASILRPLPTGAIKLSQAERDALKHGIEHSAKDEPISGVRVRSQYLRDLLLELRSGKTSIETVLDTLVTSTVAKLGTKATDQTRESIKAMLLDALRDDPTLAAWVAELENGKTT